MVKKTELIMIVTEKSEDQLNADIQNSVFINY